ncbi:hypothetical protein SprV_0602098100 [Sparganum proliferum]
MSPEVSCSGELEKVVAPKGAVQATHDTESLYQISAQLSITQRIEIKEKKAIVIVVVVADDDDDDDDDDDARDSVAGADDEAAKGNQRVNTDTVARRLYVASPKDLLHGEKKGENVRRNWINGNVSTHAALPHQVRRSKNRQTDHPTKFQSPPPDGVMTHKARRENARQPYPERPRQLEERKIDQHEADQRDMLTGISGRLSIFYVLTMESRPSSSKPQHLNKRIPVSPSSPASSSSSSTSSSSSSDLLLLLLLLLLPLLLSFFFTVFFFFFFLLLFFFFIFFCFLSFCFFSFYLKFVRFSRRRHPQCVSQQGESRHVDLLVHYFIMSADLRSIYRIPSSSFFFFSSSSSSSSYCPTLAWCGD